MLLVAGSLFATLASAGKRAPDDLTLQASPEGVGAATQTPTTVLTNTNAGAEFSKIRAGTNAVAEREKIFHWRVSWQGWDGLQLELTRKTLIGWLAPGVTNLERVTHRRNVDQQRFLYFGPAKLTAKIGGKFAMDGAAYRSDNALKDFDNDVELRRARLFAAGDSLFVLPLSYWIEVGYVPDEFNMEKSYVAWNSPGPLGELKLGQFQAPMSLENVMSSGDTTFMELAAPVQALAPGVDAGFQLGRTWLHERMTWAAGAFSQGVGREHGDASENFARCITRVTGLPVYRTAASNAGPARLLHVGLSASVLYSASSSVRYQSRPESHLAPYVVDTGVIPAESAIVAGAEAAWVNGPFSLQGEYLHSWVRQDDGELPQFDGFYTAASWFLTGESRPYDCRRGCFARVIPRNNFTWGKGGWGAWEIATRYSFVNLSSADVQGGRLSMLMAGVNWYLHPHVKMRFNYGWGRVTRRQPAGDFQLFQTRLEVDF